MSVALQDISPQFVAFPEREIVDWMNDGQTSIATFLPAMCSRIDAIKLKPGTRQSIEAITAADCKAGDGSVPAVPIYGKQFLRPVRNMGTDGLTAGLAVRMGDMKQMDVQSPNWHTVTGEIRQVFFDPQTPRYFYVSKGVPAAPAAWLEIAYVAQPLIIPNTGTPGAELYGADGANTTTLSIDDECLDPLLNYVLARARLKDAPGNDKSEAATYVALFTSWVNAKVTALTGHNPNLKRLPMAPEPLAAAS